MENASKALIIAGAILISILLISVGIMVMNSTGDITTGMEGEMDATAIRQFNSKFQNYMGTQTAAVTRELCSTVMASNASSSHTVSVNGKTASADISAYMATLNAKYNYTITITAGEDGYYNAITITQVGGTTSGGTTTNP